MFAHEVYLDKCDGDKTASSDFKVNYTIYDSEGAVVHTGDTVPAETLDAAIVYTMSVSAFPVEETSTILPRDKNVTLSLVDIERASKTHTYSEDGSSVSGSVSLDSFEGLFSISYEANMTAGPLFKNLKGEIFDGTYASVSMFYDLSDPMEVLQTDLMLLPSIMEHLGVSEGITGAVNEVAPALYLTIVRLFEDIFGKEVAS